MGTPFSNRDYENVFVAIEPQRPALLPSLSNHSAHRQHESSLSRWGGFSVGQFDEMRRQASVTVREWGQVYISALTFQGNCFKVASGKRGDVPAATY